MLSKKERAINGLDSKKRLGVRGIRVNVAAPGAIETDFGAGTVRDNPEIKGFIALQTALGRVRPTRRCWWSCCVSLRSRSKMDN